MKDLEEHGVEIDICRFCPKFVVAATTRLFKLSSNILIQQRCYRQRAYSVGNEKSKVIKVLNTSVKFVNCWCKAHNENAFGTEKWVKNSN